MKGMTVGTPGYQAPERLLHQADDALSLLNVALAPEPYSLHVPANQAMNQPLEVVIHHNKASNSFPAFYIELDENATADVLIRVKGDKHSVGSTYLQGLLCFNSHT